MLLLRSPLVCAVLLAVPIVPACMWDRDTLTREAKAMPDVIQVATGRFERNPPLYYQMRIGRESAELKSHPDHLDLYDDISVAYSRIGNDDKAIYTIERKRVRMGDMSKARTIGGKRDAFSEAAYRYYANAGTFWIVRWMRHGARRADIQQAVHSRDLIARAIEINPDAHFGREVVQLKLTDWLIGGRADSLSSYLGGGMDGSSKEEVKRNTQGLIGLVVLGALWESPDAFDALAGLIEAHYHNLNRLAYFVLQREKELVASGHKLLVENEDNIMYERPDFHDRDKIQSEFRRLRLDADQWLSERTAFMVSRLKEGRHPDTDPHFWDGYVARPDPRIEYSFFEELDPYDLILPAIVGCCSSPFIVFGIWILIRGRIRKARRASN